MRGGGWGLGKVPDRRRRPLEVNLLRSDDTDARYSQGAQGIDMEHSEAGSWQ
jgi:hypothetical protein